MADSDGLHEALRNNNTEFDCDEMTYSLIQKAKTRNFISYLFSCSMTVGYTNPLRISESYERRVNCITLLKTVIDLRERHSSHSPYVRNPAEIHAALRALTGGICSTYLWIDECTCTGRSYAQDG